MPTAVSVVVPSPPPRPTDYNYGPRDTNNVPRDDSQPATNNGGSVHNGERSIWCICLGKGESDRAGDQCRVSELLLEAGAGVNVQMNDVKV